MGFLSKLFKGDGESEEPSSDEASAHAGDASPAPSTSNGKPEAKADDGPTEQSASDDSQSIDTEPTKRFESAPKSADAAPPAASEEKREHATPARRSPPPIQAPKGPPASRPSGTGPHARSAAKPPPLKAGQAAGHDRPLTGSRARPAPTAATRPAPSPAGKRPGAINAAPPAAGKAAPPRRPIAARPAGTKADSSAKPAETSRRTGSLDRPQAGAHRRPSQDIARKDASDATAKRAAAPAQSQGERDELDEAFDQLGEPGNASPVQTEADRDGDRLAARETLQMLAVEHAKSIREFMFQLSVGCTPRRWAASCRPVLAPLLEAAKQIELEELTTALVTFDEALQAVVAGTTPYIDVEAAAPLQRGYEALSKHFPQAFGPLEAGDRCRLLVLESLLLQVPGVHRRTLDKVYSAGLSSLEQLAGAAPDELAVVAGIDTDLASALIRCVERFQRDRANVEGAALRERVLDKLRASLRSLNASQERFELAEREDARSDKRTARREREARALELTQLLAEIGELEVIEEVQRQPVRAKIVRVERFLEHAQSA